MVSQVRKTEKKAAAEPLSFGILLLIAICLLVGVVLVELGPHLCYRWIVRLAKWVVDNAVHEDL